MAYDLAWHRAIARFLTQRVVLHSTRRIRVRRQGGGEERGETSMGKFDGEDGEGSLEALDALMANVGFRDVGRRAAAGAAHADLLADYPDLRAEDIELARKIVEAHEQAWASWRRELPPFEAARFRRPRKPVIVSEFDRWVGENNISESFEYTKGWWDHIELVRRFADRLGTREVRVVGHYHIETPPPCELLPMPAVAIVTPAVTFALRHDFGGYALKHSEAFEFEWAVSVDRHLPYRGPLFGLIDEGLDLRTFRVDSVDGLAPDYLFGSYQQDQARFSCLMRDEWDVATLMQILVWNA